MISVGGKRAYSLFLLDPPQLLRATVNRDKAHVGILGRDDAFQLIFSEALASL
jgi:hypothetical protein